MSSRSRWRPGVSLGLARVHVDDEVDASGEVVDDRDLLGQQQQDVGDTEIIGFGPREFLLYDAYGVVAEVASQPAGESRQAGTQRDLELVKVVANDRERVALDRFLDLPVLEHFGDAAVVADERAQRAPRRQSDERITTEPLPAHDRFEQEGVWLVGQLEIQRKRRFEVGKALGNQRDAVVALRREGLEFEFSHMSPARVARIGSAPGSTPTECRRIAAVCA